MAEEREPPTQAQPKTAKEDAEEDARALGWLFGGAILAVAIACLVASRLMVDPGCTEGPCAQDMPLFVAVGVIPVIALAWIVTAIAMAFSDSPDDGGRNDDEINEDSAYRRLS